MPSSAPAEFLLQARFVAPIASPILRDAAVVIRDGRIAAVGSNRELRSAHPAAKPLDLGNAVLLPGLVNAHVHLELSDQAPGDPPTSFVDWLLRVIANAPPTDIAEQRLTAATRIGIEQSISAGVTTVGDITRNPQITRDVLAASPLRAVSLGEVTAMASRRQFLEPRIAAALQPSPAPDRIVAAISPHAPYSIEVAGYRKCVAAANAAHVPIATHLAESADEATFLADHSGPFRRLWQTIGGWDDAVPKFAGRPVRMAKEVGLLDSPHALLAHVNYADDGELDLLAAGRASVVYCPRTHAYFGHSPHLFRRMLERGINVAIGTDSTASSPDLNLVDDLRLMHKIAPDFPASMLWEMATLRGSKALGLDAIIGSIERGKLADLVAFPVDSSNDPLGRLLESPVGPIGVWITGQRVG